MAVLYYMSERRFLSAVIFPNVERSGWNLAA